VSCAFDAELMAGRPAYAAPWGRRLLAARGAARIVSATATPREVVDAVRHWRIGEHETAVASGAGDPYGLSLAYADAGRIDDALQALERAAANPALGMLTAAVDPRLRALRGEDRYRAVLSRWQLPIPQ
jgi:hypothetical protein